MSTDALDSGVADPRRSTFSRWLVIPLIGGFMVVAVVVANGMARDTQVSEEDMEALYGLLRKLAIGAVFAVVGVFVLIMLAQIAQPIQDGSYTGQKIDYSHQRGFIFQTNDLTTKTNDRSSTTEDWCIPDNNPELVDKVRSIEDGQRVTITYHRPLWIWPDTCDGGLKVVDSIEVTDDDEV